MLPLPYSVSGLMAEQPELELLDIFGGLRRLPGRDVAVDVELPDAHAVVARDVELPDAHAPMARVKNKSRF